MGDVDGDGKIDLTVPKARAIASGECCRPGGRGAASAGRRRALAGRARARAGTIRRRRPRHAEQAEQGEKAGGKEKAGKKEKKKKERVPCPVTGKRGAGVLLVTEYELPGGESEPCLVVFKNKRHHWESPMGHYDGLPHHKTV